MHCQRKVNYTVVCVFRTKRYNALAFALQGKKLSKHHVRPQLGFHRTLANFGQPLSNDRLLFAALPVQDPALTCSVSNSNALSNIWLPYTEVMAMKRNKPSSTDVGISVSGVGNINRDKAIIVLESKPDNLVSLTLTMLKFRK